MYREKKTIYGVLAQRGKGKKIDLRKRNQQGEAELKNSSRRETEEGLELGKLRPRTRGGLGGEQFVFERGKYNEGGQREPTTQSTGIVL